MAAVTPRTTSPSFRTGRDSAPSRQTECLRSESKRENGEALHLRQPV